ncbi:Hpt domain-containing protein [Alteraurantiacibacter buctensis]|uniref:Hpt domain-containing protein n=1 Tax=Alteraurantiacibacter buctensis TaxID=1503981 RepID=A0A844Z0P0_9SPHN|nr:Hpt domain-containing protein [Alteraurantiacibacter buctensis]MXO72274.1 Hpt domain-containing protein [Alteraurantiacibacter buctensis]
MTMDRADFEANIAAAAGDDQALRAELLASFASSLDHQIDLLRRSRCDGNWEVAARRLKSLGVSFHASDLALLADEALEAAPGDPVVLRKLDRLNLGFAALA